MGKKQGKIFIISGPAGVGKDTIIEGILKKYPNFVRVKSYSTRPPRQSDEADNRIFVTEEKFKQMIKKREMIEWQKKVHGHYYGRKRDDIVQHIKDGINVVMDVNVDGTLEYKRGLTRNLSTIKTRIDADNLLSKTSIITFFIKYEQPELFEKRLKTNRPETSNAELEIRKKSFQREMTFEKYYDYSIVNPENHPGKAIDQVLEIIFKTCKS